MNAASFGGYHGNCAREQAYAATKDMEDQEQNSHASTPFQDLRLRFTCSTV